MSRPSSSNQQLYPKCESRQTSSDALIRRPIHKEQEHLNKGYGEGSCDSKEDSPSKPGRLYPGLTDEDELDIETQENEKNESFHKSSERKQHYVSKSQKFKEKESFENSRVQKTLYVPPVMEQTESPLFKYVALLVMVILILICFLFKLHTSDIINQNKTEVNIIQIIEGMQNHFKDQNLLTYRILKLALKRVVNVEPEPSAPAIITLIANKEAENTASEFSQYLAKALAPQKYVLINESTYWHSDPDYIKLKIDEEIKSKVEKNSLNVVIVDSLQNIPYEAAMIFHSYCDHELAPYKRAVFLFIVPLNEILPENANGRHIDTVAMYQLRNIWHRATSDDIDSLITRMTVNVVNIR